MPSAGGFQDWIASAAPGWATSSVTDCAEDIGGAHIFLFNKVYVDVWSAGAVLSRPVLLLELPGWAFASLLWSRPGDAC